MGSCPLKYNEREGGVQMPGPPTPWALQTSRDVFEGQEERNRTPDTVARMRRSHSSISSSSYGAASPLLQWDQGAPKGEKTRSTPSATTLAMQNLANVNGGKEVSVLRNKAQTHWNNYGLNGKVVFDVLPI